MLEWISTFGVDVKGIITAVLGAFFGAVIKWLLDREEKAQLRTAINAQRCETRSLGERLQATHGRLSEQETANDVKQKELERLSDLLKGKGVDIQKREDRLTKLLGDRSRLSRIAHYRYIGSQGAAREATNVVRPYHPH